MSIVITPVLPTIELEDSLNMGDEHLSTIPEKESDKVIKSSVKDLVPILSESKDTSESDSDCDLPSYDDFSSIDVPRDNSVTLYNPLFDDNDDFTSSDDESLPEEDVLEDIESEDSYVSKLDDLDLLVTPLSKLNEDECFDSGGDFILEEIEAWLTSDSIPLEIDDANFDLNGDILIIEKLLNDDPSSPLPSKELNFEEHKDTIPNLPPEVFFDHDTRSLKDEPDKDNLKHIVKVFDPRIHKKFFSPTYVRLSFEDHLYLSLTYVILIFLPFLTYSVNSPFLLSFRSEDTTFDPGIFAFHFSSLEPVASHQSGTFMIARIMKTLSPTKSLFDVGSSRISIFTVNTKEYHSDCSGHSKKDNA
ncbi:hypothetical protein Tco_1135172 [Tanacetum coccineum]